MNYKQLFFTFLLASTSFFLYARSDCKHSSSVFKCLTYLDNYDGDTITVHIPDTHPLFGEAIKVRIIDIDTPEIHGTTSCEKDRALYVKEYVKSLLSGAKYLELRSPSRDKYFRILGDIWFDGKSLKNLLLEKKLAIPYDGGRKIDYDWCQTIKL